MDNAYEQLAARNADLEREKEALAEQLDKAEGEVARLYSDNRDLRKEVVAWRGA